MEECGCLDGINDAIAKSGRNTQIGWTLDFSTGVKKVRIATIKADESKREKPIAMEPKFCPFCGKSYPVASKGETNVPL